MKIAVAGAGWYGCHVASSLKAHGVEVVVFEKNAEAFSEASGNNQFRLHLGLHYARSAITRHQSRDGYHRFVERYPKLSKPVARNLYLVPREESLLDFETYFSIMLSSGIQVERLALTSQDGLAADRFEGVVRCEERVVQTELARSYFKQRLNGSLRLNSPVERVDLHDTHVYVNGARFDHFVDATWGGLLPLDKSTGGVYFEPTLLLYYRQRASTGPAADSASSADSVFPAITLVDGKLWSIYPTDLSGVYTLSSVTHTPLGYCGTKAEAYGLLAAQTQADVREHRALMEAEVVPYLPDFVDRFEYLGPQWAIKTKPIGQTDNRACGVQRVGPAFRVLSGKIDNIFFATDRILGAVLPN